VRYTAARKAKSASASSPVASANGVAHGGLFSPSYFLYYEEIDYARRAAASGYGLGWCRGSIVFHKGGASAGSKIGGNARKSVTAEYHSNLSALKYTRKFHPGILPVAFVSRLCLKVVHAAISHDLRLLRPLFEAYRDFLLARETS
jgi:GT2 family glycosyltransferase